MRIRRENIPIFKSIDMVTRRLPQVVVESDNPGPTAWVTAAIHGDEVTSTAVAQSLMKRLETYPLVAGTLYIVPILNPTGFESVSRREQYFESDLNRSFDGDMHGNPSERLAAIILESVLQTKPDFLIDLHTDSMNSIPYTIIDGHTHKDYQTTVKKSIVLAQQLGLWHGLDSDDSAGYPMTRSFSGQLVARGVPAVTVELGGPLVVNEEMRKIGLEAVWRVLFEEKMVTLKSSETAMTTQTEAYYFMERIPTQSTGIVEYRVKPGQVVEKDELMAKVRNVYGDTIEMVRAPQKCMIFSHEDQSVTFPGLDLFTVVKMER